MKKYIDIDLYNILIKYVKSKLNKICEWINIAAMRLFQITKFDFKLFQPYVSSHIENYTWNF